MNKKTYYQIEGIFKDIEEDTFDRGCTGLEISSYPININIEAATLEELKHEFAYHIGVPVKDIDVGPENILAVQQLEDRNGFGLDDIELKSWKRGKYKAYLCTYTAYVYKTTKEEVDLSTQA